MQIDIGDLLKAPGPSLRCLNSWIVNSIRVVAHDFLIDLSKTLVPCSMLLSDHSGFFFFGGGFFFSLLKRRPQPP